MNRLLTVLLGVVPLIEWSWLAGHAQSSQDRPKSSEQKYHHFVNSIGMKLMPIPAGEFMMGAGDDDRDASEDEKPRHRVRITRPFYLGAFEVTQEEFERVMGSNPSFFSPTGPGKERVKGMDTRRFPAEQVRWVDAVAFCRRLSEMPAEKKSGRAYRLPSEVEWEYACRAGTTTPFHFGKSLSSKQANFNGKHPHGGADNGPFLVRTTKVGSYPANAFGLHDMHGNVWEWCADWYGRNYYRESPGDDPRGPKTGSMRVIRGGEWYADGRDCRSSFRYADVPTGVFYVMGFRVALDLPGNGIAIQDIRPGTDTVEVVTSKRKRTRVEGEDWPRWRGPRGDGTWKGPALPEKWPTAGPKLIWRQPVGGGYAGVVVADGRTVCLDYQTESSRERVLCFDADTGQSLWLHSYPVKYGKLSYANGPRATPTIFAGKLYTLGAVGHLLCLDAASGKVRWSVDLVKEKNARVPIWGFSASPVIFDELVIIHAGAEPDGCMIAFERATGKEVWRSLPDPAGYATPILTTAGAQAQLVCWTPTHVRGLDPRTGKLLWSLPFEVTYGTAIATPIFHAGLAFVSNYYEGARAIRLGKEGDGRLAWQDRNLRGLMSQPLYRNGLAYLLDRRNGLTCFELKTGKKLWDDGNRMTPKGRNPQATLVWLGDSDRAIVLNSEGDLILVRLSAAGYREDARVNIIGPTWAHPAYARGCVYARSDTELVCRALWAVAGTPVGLRPPSVPATAHPPLQLSQGTFLSVTTPEDASPCSFDCEGLNFLLGRPSPRLCFPPLEETNLFPLQEPCDANLEPWLLDVVAGVSDCFGEGGDDSRLAAVAWSGTGRDFARVGTALGMAQGGAEVAVEFARRQQGTKRRHGLLKPGHCQRANLHNGRSWP